ncbi:hypothetical protein ACN28S_13145 [Cystobacter fuscus]
MRVPSELRGLRTLFNALHHFRPEQVYTWEVGEVSKPGKPTVSYVLGLPERSAPR